MDQKEKTVFARIFSIISMFFLVFAIFYFFNKQFSIYYLYGRTSDSQKNVERKNQEQPVVSSIENNSKEGFMGGTQGASLLIKVKLPSGIKNNLIECQLFKSEDEKADASRRISLKKILLDEKGECHFDNLEADSSYFVETFKLAEDGSYYELYQLEDIGRITGEEAVVREIFLNKNYDMSAAQYVFCRDNDGRKAESPYIKSYVEISGEKKQDACATTAKVAEKACLRKEDGSWTYQDKNINCPYGCRDGACIKKENMEKCVDSDEGREYYKSGTATGVLFSGFSGKIKGENPDQCSERFDEQQLLDEVRDCCLMAGKSNEMHESYCDKNGMIGIVKYICPNGCFNGRCEK